MKVAFLKSMINLRDPFAWRAFFHANSSSEIYGSVSLPSRTIVCAVGDSITDIFNMFNPPLFAGLPTDGVIARIMPMRFLQPYGCCAFESYSIQNLKDQTGLETIVGGKVPKYFASMLALCQRAGSHEENRQAYGAGREIPIFFIRNCRVERLMPRRKAAPFGPPSTQFVSLSTARICLRSAS